MSWSQCCGSVNISQQYGCAGCIPFQPKKYRHAGCTPFHPSSMDVQVYPFPLASLQYGRAGCIPFHCQHCRVQGGPISTTSSVNVHGVIPVNRLLFNLGIFSQDADGQL
jgi:hypothetical protein